MSTNTKKPDSNLNQVLYNDTTKLAPVIEFMTAVNLGLIPGARSFTIQGENPDVDSGPVESIWMGGGIYEFSSQLEQYNIASDNVVDAVGGSGAITIEVIGLNGDFNEDTEELTLTGTTNVLTTKSYNHIQRINVLTAGASGGNVGTLSAIGAVSTLQTIAILPARNQSAIGSFMVPANETWYATGILLSVAKQANAAATFSFLVKRFGEVFRTASIIGVHSNGTPAVQTPQAAFNVLLPKTQVRIDVESTAANISAASEIEILAIQEGATIP